jgi:hypothetical protein
MAGITFALPSPNGWRAFPAGTVAAVAATAAQRVELEIGGGRSLVLDFSDPHVRIAWTLDDHEVSVADAAVAAGTQRLRVLDATLQALLENERFVIEFDFDDESFVALQSDRLAAELVAAGAPVDRIRAVRRIPRDDDLYQC